MCTKTNKAYNNVMAWDRQINVAGLNQSMLQFLEEESSTYLDPLHM